ncbi:MAG: type II toxin-antitoxin system RelB/DinJ family antitoxin [Candidatus Nomurabacteria bacterium]|nr:type II toxin-antitoxin system RelB/DinJ family antitoxin [Candidatus Nomurabacteria bacterium]
MANTELVQVRIDPKLKKDVERIFAEIGFDMPSALRMFLKRVQREEDFPFDVRMFNDETIRAINKANRGAKKMSGHLYNDVNEMSAHILGSTK